MERYCVVEDVNSILAAQVVERVGNGEEWMVLRNDHGLAVVGWRVA